MLREAAKDGEVLVFSYLSGSAVQVNGKNLVEEGNPRSEATWDGAVRDLVKCGFLQSVGNKGQIFRMTREGYEAAELLK